MATNRALAQAKRAIAYEKIRPDRRAQLTSIIFSRFLSGFIGGSVNRIFVFVGSMFIFFGPNV